MENRGNVQDESSGSCSSSRRSSFEPRQNIPRWPSRLLRANSSTHEVTEVYNSESSTNNKNIINNINSSSSRSPGKFSADVMAHEETRVRHNREEIEEEEEEDFRLRSSMNNSNSLESTSSSQSTIVDSGRRELYHVYDDTYDSSSLLGRNFMSDSPGLPSESKLNWEPPSRVRRRQLLYRDTDAEEVNSNKQHNNNNNNNNNNNKQHHHRHHHHREHELTETENEINNALNHESLYEEQQVEDIVYDHHDNDDIDIERESATVVVEMPFQNEDIHNIETQQQHENKDTSDPNTAIIDRMKYETPEDPRNHIINFIVNSPSGSVTLQSIHDALQWNEYFEETNGSVLDYLQGYQSIFAVSPIDDRVTLRRPLQTGKGRRTVRENRGVHVISSRIGSISCSYVATSFDLDALTVIYKRRGYEAVLIYDVLHVSSQHTFDLFIFPNGVVVWWGLNRRDHWIVEDDFLSSGHSFVSEAIKERHSQENIDELFPIWCSYELDEHYNSNSLSNREEALKRFATYLCFDHYLIPDVEPLRSQVMLTVSYSLGRTAVVDLFDNVTQTLHKQVLILPSDIKGLLDYFSTKRQIANLEGELHLALMAITALRDSPEFLWEMAWLDEYYELVERQNSSEQLLSWFSAKSDALLQQIANIKARRFRLFMLGSDVFLIFLLVADVCFIMTSFVMRLYFPLEENET